MFYFEFDVNHARGVRIAEEIRFDGQVLEKGHELTEEDIIQLKLSGITKIFGAEMGENDISNETALGIIAAKICGNNTAYTIGKNGLCKIVAVKDGVLVCADDRVAKFNRLSHNLVLNTIEPYALVKAGEVIAELELTLPIIEQAMVDEIIFNLSGNVELISVAVQKKKKTALVYTKLYNDVEETKHFTDVVTKLVKDFSELQFDFKNEYNARHTIDDVGNAVQKAVDDGNDLIFILPGQRTADVKDVVPAALNSYVDELVNVSIPQVGASDLMIAEKRGQKIISLPYNYDKLDSKLADHFIKLAIVNERIHGYDFSRPQNVLLTAGQALSEQEQGTLFTSENKKLGKGEANIAVVVLAAGIGSRAGRNKLMLEVDEKPMFLKAVEAAVKSKASPVFVITGYNAAEMEELLEDIDVNVIYNPSFRAGVRTSITLGLKSVPGFCDGVLLLPADMPNITPEFINKMIKSFKKTEEKQVCMAAWKGNKRNPVIWSKSLFDVADMVPENADLRPVFMEHSDYTNLVEAPNEKVLLDVNFPNDIDKLKNK